MWLVFHDRGAVSDVIEHLVGALCWCDKGFEGLFQPETQ